MKKTFLFSLIGAVLLGLSLGFTSCESYIRIAPSPIMETKTVDITNIQSIDVGSAFKLELIKSDVERIEVEANENLFPHIRLVKERGRLIACFRNNIRVYDHYSVTIRFYYTDLREIDLHGASRAEFMDSVTNLSYIELDMSGASELQVGVLIADEMEIDLSGSSRMRGVIDGRRMDIDLNGASRMDVAWYADIAEVDLSGASELITTEGWVDKLDIELSGGSQWRGLDVECQRVIMEASGGASAWLTVKQSFVVNASGGSDIYYRGNPTNLSINKSGGASVRPY